MDSRTGVEWPFQACWGRREENYYNYYKISAQVREEIQASTLVGVKVRADLGS